MLHGSGCTEVVVGVQRRSHCVAVAAWHGSGGQSHGLVVVAAVMSRRLWHGYGGSGGSDSGYIAPRWLRGMMVAAMQRRQQQLVTLQCSYEGGSDMAHPAMRRMAMGHVQL
jgi:hypothetical protein